MKMAINNLAGYLTDHPSNIVALLCLFLTSLPAAAETVEVKLPTGISASANFHTGNPSQPAIFLLHGFHQTHHSQPMSFLAGNLASRGYTVLSPTITLGVNKRNQSMACEAVHTHSMKEDVAEIDYWVNWLGKKDYKNIVLIGFSSTGNIEILSYNTQRSHPAVKKAILVSMNPILTDIRERQEAQSLKNAKQHSDVKKLGVYSVGYCKNNFTATASNYLSYAQYDASRILELIRQTSVPTELIFGSADTMLPANWPSQIKALKTRAQVTIINKANHFFDDTSEFDLAEEIENILKNIPAQHLAKDNYDQHC